MQLHHSKHHATYVANLNVAEEKMAEAVAKSKNNFFQIGIETSVLDSCAFSVALRILLFMTLGYVHSRIQMCGGLL